MPQRTSPPQLERGAWSPGSGKNIPMLKLVAASPAFSAGSRRSHSAVEAERPHQLQRRQPAGPHSGGHQAPPPVQLCRPAGRPRAHREYHMRAASGVVGSPAGLAARVRSSRTCCATSTPARRKAPILFLANRSFRTSPSARRRSSPASTARCARLQCTAPSFAAAPTGQLASSDAPARPSSGGTRRMLFSGAPGARSLRSDRARGGPQWQLLPLSALHCSPVLSQPRFPSPG